MCKWLLLWDKNVPHDSSRLHGEAIIDFFAVLDQNTDTRCMTVAGEGLFSMDMAAQKFTGTEPLLQLKAIISLKIKN